MSNIEMKSEDFNWCKEPIIGLCLLGAEHDSNGHQIEPYRLYIVGKHKKTGMLAICPTNEDVKNDLLNNNLKAAGALN